MKKIYGTIAKTEELDDGTVKVWGYASSAAVDADGETITSEAMKAAIPGYMKFGAVREMHKSDAAGTALEASVQEDGRTFFGAHIIDPVAVKKVRANVYKGFSIGGRVTSRDDLNKSIITGINLIEVSLVDRPANPEAIFTMYKADTLEGGTGDLGEPDDANKVSAVDVLADHLNKGTVTPEELVAFIKSKGTEPVVVEKAAEPVVVEKAAEPVVVEKAAEPVVVEKAAEVLLVKDDEGLAKVQAIADDLQKRFDEQGVAFAAAAATVEAFGKAFNLAEGEDLLVKAQGIIAEHAELLDLKKSWDDAPAKAKAILKVLSKGDDANIVTPKDSDPVKKADGKVNEAATAIKKLHSSGGQPYLA